VRRNFFPPCLGGLLLFSAIVAAQPGMVGPVEAFAFDAPTRSLRAVSGLLGSSTFGPILIGELDNAFVAPQMSYAIAIRDGQAWFASGLGSGNIGMSKLPVAVRPDGVAWSRDGSVAVLYSLSGSSIQLVSGLPGAANVAAPVDLTPLGGSLLKVAADTTGQNVAIGIGGNGGSIYLMDRNSNFVPVAGVANPVAVLFSDDGKTLYALDGNSKQLLEVSTADFTSQDLDLSDLMDPIAVAGTSDSTGRRVIYVAGGQDSVLRSYDATTNQIITTVPLAFQPTSLQVFGGTSFILAPRTSATAPLWAFRNAAVPAAYFVPAAPAVPLQVRKDIQQ
jgi:hypothetical protein